MQEGGYQEVSDGFASGLNCIGSWSLVNCSQDPSRFVEEASPVRIRLSLYPEPFYSHQLHVWPQDRCILRGCPRSIHTVDMQSSSISQHSRWSLQERSITPTLAAKQNTFFHLSGFPGRRVTERQVYCTIVVATTAMFAEASIPVNAI